MSLGNIEQRTAGIKKQANELINTTTRTNSLGKHLEGQRFGLLTVIKLEPSIINKSGNVYRRWLCKCDCGNEKVILQTSLTSGKTKSCGCLHDTQNIKHGDGRKRLYREWQNMKSRCNNPKMTDYENYGMRGIKVCDEWCNSKGYENFKEWALKNGYKDNLTIDRIDVNGNYEPSNCRWATRMQQNNNRRCNVFIEYNGDVHTLSEWSEILGINRSTLNSRYRKGLSSEKILSKIDITKSHRRSRKC